MLPAAGSRASAATRCLGRAYEGPLGVWGGPGPNGRPLIPALGARGPSTYDLPGNPLSYDAREELKKTMRKHDYIGNERRFAVYPVRRTPGSRLSRLPLPYAGVAASGGEAQLPPKERRESASFGIEPKPGEGSASSDMRRLLAAPQRRGGRSKLRLPRASLGI
jgi:hypothetical protein